MSEPPRASRLDEKVTLEGLSSWPPPLSAPAAQESALVDDRYHLLRRIGTGGLASVWEAEDRELALRVALKLPRAESADDVSALFEREARALASITHPNIVHLLAHGVAPTFGPYLVMELLTGPSLDEHLAVGTPRAVREVLEWLAPVAAALELLHARSLVHRDVKPANIVRDGAGVVKLVDFGLVAHADGRDQLIRGRVAGTPHYLAPEVAQGGLATPASDVYAIGVVAFELLTGRLPHEETTAVELMRAKVSRPAPSLATTSGLRFAPKLERVMGAALSAEPGDRPMAAELIERLRSCIR